MSKVYKVIVTCRLETGDDIDVSVKSIDKPLSSKDREELDRRIAQNILSHVDDTLFFKIRYTADTKKDNWNKLKTISEVSKILDTIFCS